MLLVVVILVGLPTAASADSFRPEVDGLPIAVSPSVGGQGSTFSIEFVAPGVENGIEDEGEGLAVRGPARTPCAGELDPPVFVTFAAGHARLDFGPHPPRPAFTANVIALRVVRRWCPGVYTGKIHLSVGESSSGGSRTFRFRVGPSSNADPGRRLRALADSEVERRPPVNPPWLKVRQLPGRQRAVRVDLLIGGHGEQAFSADFRAPGSCEFPEPDFLLVFRPGRARVTVGGRGGRFIARNHRRIAARSPLCRGRWLGFFGDTPFTFVVR